MRKHTQSKVDKALSEISKRENGDDILYEWQELCKFNSPQKSLMKFLHNEGFTDISTMNISTWWKRNRVVGTESQVFNNFCQQYEGIDTDKLRNLSLGLSVKLALALNQNLTDDVIAGGSPNTKLSNLIELLKEIRMSATEISREKLLEYKADIMFEGILYLESKLKQTFKGTNFEEPLVLASEEIINNYLQGS